MAETTTTRFGLHRWSAGTDTPSRAEIDGNVGILETLGAIDVQDIAANKPSPGIRGRYFWDTTNSMLSRDDGSAWAVVGSKTLDAIIKSSTTGNVALTVDSPSGQTADLQQWKVNGTLVSAMLANGGLNVGGAIQSKNMTANAPDATTVTSLITGFSAQTAALFRVQANGGATRFQVAADGTLTSPNFSTTGSGGTTSAVVGDSTATTVAGYGDSRWTGNPAFEIRMNRTGAFNDFLLLQHVAAANTDATRRFGIVMKLGAQDSAGATASGALYLRSDFANFTSPSMRLDVSNTTVWDFSSQAVFGSETDFKIRTNAYLQAAANNGTTGSVQMVSTWMGTQNTGSSQYFRAATTSDQFNWYAGGQHNDTLNSPGSGGVMLAKLTNVASNGAFETGRIHLTAVSDADAANTNPSFAIGPYSGQNLQLDDNEILAVNNGSLSGALLMVQSGGGTLALGGSTTSILYNGIPFFVSVNGTGPSGPSTNDLWLDGRVGQGLKKWNGSTWQLI